MSLQKSSMHFDNNASYQDKSEFDFEQKYFSQQSLEEQNLQFDFGANNPSQQTKERIWLYFGEKNSNNQTL